MAFNQSSLSAFISIQPRNSLVLLVLQQIEKLRNAWFLSISEFLRWCHQESNHLPKWLNIFGL